PPRSTPFPYTTLFRSIRPASSSIHLSVTTLFAHRLRTWEAEVGSTDAVSMERRGETDKTAIPLPGRVVMEPMRATAAEDWMAGTDRKSTRLNSSHVKI